MEGKGLGKYYSREANNAIRFNYVELTEKQKDDINYVKRNAATLYDFIRYYGSGDDVANALHYLEIFTMFATKAMAQDSYEG